MSQVPARERILTVAKRLFYREGFRATVIDRIIAESGVAKMSLYRNFPSKNHLISAFLEWRHEHWMNWFVAGVEARFAQNARLCVIADTLGAWFSEEDFRGCAFINSVAESGVTKEPSHLHLAVRHKACVESYIRDISVRLSLEDPETAGQEAMLCVEGMIVRAQVRYGPAIVDAGRRLLALIEKDGRSMPTAGPDG